MANVATGKNKRQNLFRLVPYGILTLFALAMLLPFIWMLSTSFKPASQVIQYPPRIIPNPVTWANYVGLVKRVNIFRLYQNSTIIATSKTAFVVFTSAITGYVLGKFRFRGRDLIFYGILSTMIIPFEVYMIPLYLSIVKLGWGGTYTAIVLPFGFNAYGIFLYRQFLHTIPDDLLDAARIDGAGEMTIFFRMILPSTKSALATLTIFFFLWEWNDFLWPLIVLNSTEKFTLPLGLANFVSEYATDYGVTMAGATVAMIPILIVFILMQRHFIQSLTISGFKG